MPTVRTALKLSGTFRPSPRTIVRTAARRAKLGYRQVRAATKKLGRRLYRIETGYDSGASPKIFVTTVKQNALFKALGSSDKSPSPIGYQEAASRLKGRNLKHYWTRAGWKKFGRPAFKQMSADLKRWGEAKPKIRHKRARPGQTVKVPETTVFGTMTKRISPWEVLAGGGVGGTAVTRRRRPRAVKSGGRSQLRRRR